MANRKVVFLDESTGRRGQVVADEDVVLCTGIARATAGNLSINPGSGGAVRVVGNLGISLTNPGVAATTNGDDVVHLANAGTVPVGTLTGGGALFYATAGTMRVLDAGGNDSLISPHDRKTGEWIFESKRNGKQIRIQMERFMKRLEKHFGWGLIEERKVRS